MHASALHAHMPAIRTSNQNLSWERRRPALPAKRHWTCHRKWTRREPSAASPQVSAAPVPGPVTGDCSCYHCTFSCIHMQHPPPKGEVTPATLHDMKTNNPDTAIPMGIYLDRCSYENVLSYLVLLASLGLHVYLWPGPSRHTTPTPTWSLEGCHTPPTWSCKAHGSTDDDMWYSEHPHCDSEIHETASQYREGW